VTFASGICEVAFNPKTPKPQNPKTPSMNYNTELYWATFYYVKST
jgi:hypothetical protein